MDFVFYEGCLSIAVQIEMSSVHELHERVYNKMIAKELFYTKSVLSMVFVILMGFQGFASEKVEKGKVEWKKHVINADSPFEAAGIGDINKDGRKDIVCGSYWYEAPNWKKHFIVELEEIHGYYNDFANEIQDVDGDGDLDVVSVAYFSKQVMWRENPGSEGGEWIIHVVDEPGNMETAIFVDLNQDGLMDLLPDINTTVAWYEKQSSGNADDYWIKHTIGTEGKGHGIGAGDVNNDDIMDIISPHGWYEGQKKGKEMSWSWHPEFELGSTSIPILVHDVDRDGLNDIIWGMGHDYGIYWLEQNNEDGKRTWQRHLIDKSWSQPHYMEFIDVGCDGKMDLVTGKRYHAHNGKDPGGNESRCIYVYTYDSEKKEWQRSVVEEGGTAGFGLHPAIGDIDKDGDADLVCPGKSGLYLFEQIIPHQ